MKAVENNDEKMAETILTASLTDNFFDKGGFTYELAEKYQKLLAGDLTHKYQCIYN